MPIDDKSEEEPSFSARIETERVGPELFRAVLVMLVSQRAAAPPLAPQFTAENIPDDVQPDADTLMLRIPLAGEHPTELEARFAAKLAIEAMARTSDN